MDESVVTHTAGNNEACHELQRVVWRVGKKDSGQPTRHRRVVDQFVHFSRVER